MTSHHHKLNIIELGYIQALRQYVKETSQSEEDFIDYLAQEYDSEITIIRSVIETWRSRIFPTLVARCRNIYVLVGTPLNASTDAPEYDDMPSL